MDSTAVTLNGLPRIAHNTLVQPNQVEKDPCWTSLQEEMKEEGEGEEGGRGGEEELAREEVCNSMYMKCPAVAWNSGTRGGERGGSCLLLQ